MEVDQVSKYCVYIYIYIDESKLADRERRKNKIVMYDLPEAEDREADRLSVLENIQSLNLFL